MTGLLIHYAQAFLQLLTAIEAESKLLWAEKKSFSQVFFTLTFLSLGNRGHTSFFDVISSI